MTGSDDHPEGKTQAPGPVIRTPDSEDEVHSSAELDFDQLTTSTMDFPAIEIIPAQVETMPSPKAPDVLTEVESAMDEAPSIFDQGEHPSTPMERVTFSNLEALVPEKPAKPVEKEQPAAARPVQRQTTIHEVRPPSFARFFTIAILLAIVGIIVFFGYRIDWDMKLLRTDPGIALKVALGVQEKPKPVQPKPEAPQKTDSLRGELSPMDVTLERVSQGPDKGALIVKGRLQNNTNRMQTMVMLRASLLSPDGLPLESRKHQCCQLEDTAGSEKGKRPATSLKPGDVKYFSVIFSRKHSRKKKIRPRVEVLFSESERVP